MTGSKVLVGMSGGVDSSVAAFLLKQQGYDVHGFTLRMWGEVATEGRMAGTTFREEGDEGEEGEEGEEGRCCSREDIEAAVQVSRKIGIPHTIIDIRKQFKEEVVDYFLEEYRQGRTPNPCAVCNQRIRFGSFWKSVDRFGARYLATGHYARILSAGLSNIAAGFQEMKKGEYLLAKARDKRKSQEYFLALIPKERLKDIIFPLGDLTKSEVRNIALSNNLPVIYRESQDICFIPDGDTTRFLCKHLGSRPGEIVDMDGKVLGTHRGVWCYTIGQRKGLGIAASKPLYVISVDIQNNRVVVGPRSALAGSSFSLSQINRFTEADLSPLPLTCKIRYATPAVGCRLDEEKVVLERPVDAITPGQLGVIYWKDKVVMAGVIS